MAKKIKPSAQARKKLSALRENIKEDAPPKESWFPGATGADEGTNLNQFLASLVGRKTRKKHQLQKIKEFFENPQLYGVDIHDTDTSSSDEEIEQRKRDLRYRISLLSTLLDAAKTELNFLDQAKENKKK